MDARVVGISDGSRGRWEDERTHGGLCGILHNYSWLYLILPVAVHADYAVVNRILTLGDYRRFKHVHVFAFDQ